MRGRDKYLTRRKAKHLGFLTESGFQVGRFMLKVFKKMLEAWILKKMLEAWILNRLLTFV